MAGKDAQWHVTDTRTRRDLLAPATLIPGRADFSRLLLRLRLPLPSRLLRCGTAAD